MIDGKLNQQAVWHRAKGLTAHGEVVTEATNISVRWEECLKKIVRKDGQEVISQATVFCREPVQPGDSLEYGGRKWPVLQVIAPPSLDGTVWFRQVYV